jgi:hypothetical protein
MRWFSYILCLALVMLVPAAASAQLGPRVDPEPLHPTGEDTHALRFILSRVLKCEPLTDLDDLNEDPTKSVLIVLGSTTWMDQSPDTLDKLAEFMNGRGTALIATDNPSPTISKLFGIRSRGPTIKTDNPKKDGYREWDDCPMISARDSKYPFFQNLDHIATHQPVYVKKTNNFDIKTVARFPDSCQVDNDEDRGLKGPAFALLCDQYKKPALVLSSQSVFWNNLMLQYDNDNFAFAYKTLRWLTEADDQGAKRKNVLLIDEGVPVKSFEVKVREVPANLPGDLADLPAHPVDIANGLLAKWEDENIHNELLFGRYSGGQILSGVVIALTVLLAFWLFFRIQQALQRAETG